MGIKSKYTHIIAEHILGWKKRRVFGTPLYEWYKDGMVMDSHGCFCPAYKENDTLKVMDYLRGQYAISIQQDLDGFICEISTYEGEFIARVRDTSFPLAVSRAVVTLIQ